MRRRPVVSAEPSRGKRVIRLSLKLAIVILWASMMGFLVRMEFFAPSDFPSTVPETGAAREGVPAKELWFGVYLKGQKIGYLRSIRQRSPHGYVFKEQTRLKLRLMGMDKSVNSEIVVLTDDSVRPVSFRSRLRSGAVSLMVYGKIEGDLCKLEIHSAGRTQQRVIHIPQGTILSPEMRLFLSRGVVERKGTYTLSLFDPLAMKVRPLKIQVEGKGTYLWDGQRVPAYRVMYSWGDLRVRGWLDLEGDPLQEDSFMGWSLVREDEGKAKGQGWAGGNTKDLWDEMGIPTIGSIPSPRNTSYLRIRLKGMEVSRLPNQTARQRIIGKDVIEVQREKLPPDVNRHGKTSVRPHLNDYIRPTTWIQSSDPRIVSLAKRIVSGRSGCVDMARELVKWVFVNLKKEPMVSMPSAVVVLELGRGDCNEHAVLLAALARAVGIPARLSAGVVYMGGKLLYHAWDELYVGSWVCVDPTLGQFPCDATHITFVRGGVDDLLEMGSLMGGLEAEVLESR